MSEGERKGAGWLMMFALGWRMITGRPKKAWSVERVPSAEVAAGPGDYPLPAGRESDTETQAVTPRRERWGTLLVACVLIAAIAAGIGFLFIFWTDGGNKLLGGTLALSFAGFGIALVLWSHFLMAHKEAIEPLEPLLSPEEERQTAAEDFCAGARDVKRRSLLKFMTVAGAGVFAAMFVSLLRSFGAPTEPALYQIVWRRGQRLMTADNKPVSIHSLRPGDSVTVFPEGSIGNDHAQTVLVRVQEQFLRLPADRADWAPLGYLAYSRVCTHAGCPVGMFESQTNLLLCPCHQSTFNVLTGAEPTGGPAARPLPQLPLYADDEGLLRAGGRFSSIPGPGFWGGQQ
jgi:ubiquinol-cytochrome c reductase iron-sulfur subunit